MGRLQEEANKFRRAVNTRDADAVDALLSRYAGVWRALLPQVQEITRQIEARRREGKTFSPSWLYRQERYKALMQQIGAEVENYAQFASERVRQEVVTSIYEAENHALSLMDTAAGKKDIEGGDSDGTVLSGMGAQPEGVLLGEVRGGIDSWNRLPTAALNEMIANVQTGSPVAGIFALLPRQAQAAAKQALVLAVGQGLNPRQTARALRQATGYTAYRAATIARTESLRAYRTAAHETYRANDDIVLGWIWLAALSRRTCPMCLALHGKRFPLEADFGTHPNCRCTQIPVTEEDYTIPTGEDWFARQPADTQEHILGKAKAQAYKDGRITLSDLIGEREDKEWGLVRFEKSLKEALK